MTAGRATIIRGDARALPIADDSVDLIVTSPPYFALRSYQDAGVHYAGQIGDEPTPAAFVDSLLEVTRECMRVLKPAGSLWVNLGDKYANDGKWGGASGHRHYADDRGRSSHRARRNTGIPAKSLMGIPWRYAIRCIDELGLILRAEVIWSKPNGLPESVSDRVRRSHEHWFHFTAQPRYFSAVDEIREQHVRGPRPNEVRGEPGRGINGGVVPGRSDFGRPGNKPADFNPLGRLPGSVWKIPTEPLHVPAEVGVDHFAAFPSEWPRRLIAAWSPPAGVVLDPFGGTGTTALVARVLGRHGISVDMSADYCRLATWRTTDPGQIAKAMRVEKPRPQVDGQASLFEDISG